MKQTLKEIALLFIAAYCFGLQGCGKSETPQPAATTPAVAPSPRAPDERIAKVNKLLADGHTYIAQMKAVGGACTPWVPKLEAALTAIDAAKTTMDNAPIQGYVQTFESMQTAGCNADPAVAAQPAVRAPQQLSPEQQIDAYADQIFAHGGICPGIANQLRQVNATFGAGHPGVREQLAAASKYGCL
jgi:hypothetical protein